MKSLIKNHIYRYAGLRITFQTVFVSLIVFLFMFYSCQRSETLVPSIYLTTDSGYVFKDTVLASGDPFNVQINADFGGDVNITNVIIRNEHEGIVTNYFDTGMNVQTIKISKLLTKSVYDKEVWTFIAIDKNGGNASVSFTVTKDPGSVYGNIRHLNATMGAQSSTLIGSFMSLNTGVTYFQDSAFAHQDSIEMLYYYDAVNGEANTIASPNANMGTTIYTGSSGPLNWALRNETRYYKTTLTLADFNACNNDSLLLVSYSELNAKRKAKNLVVGDIYSFKTAHNKYGLFYTQDLIGLETGSVNAIILIQQ